MAGHVHLLPWRELAKKLAQDLLILPLEGGNFGGHVKRLRCRSLAQLGNAPLELEEPFLALDDDVIAHADTYSRRRTSVSFSFRRSTTMSIAPLSSRNSAVWN